MPPMQSLVVFEASARKLSFTAAAEELHSTQPAVSQQIRTLESFLDTALFTRIYRGVQLTEDGQRLFTAVHEGLSTIRDAVAELQKKSSHPSITVATDFAFAAYWLMPKLPEYRRLHPGVDIRIQTSQYSLTLPGQGVDVSIVFGTWKDAQESGLRWRTLFQEYVFPVCSPLFAKTVGPVRTLEALASQPLLKLSSEHDHTWLDWNAFFRKNQSPTPVTEPVMVFNNYTLLIQAAVAGQGVGLGWAHLVDDLLKQGFLTTLSDFSITTDQGYSVACQQDTPPQAVATFVEWLVEQTRISP